MKLLAALTLLACAVAASQAAAEEAGAPVEVMVLGTYHFANPGRDIVNIRSASVLTADRQRELQVLADSLARFEPTRIVVEHQASGPDFEVPSYREFRPEMLAEQENERVQIGYRLAHRLGHAAVYGFDEQPSDGEPDYFPFSAVQRFAAEDGQSERIETILTEVRGFAEQLEREQPDRSIPELLQAHNNRAQLSRMHGLAYYGLLTIGDGDQQPGAELNAFWFMRNAKMFAKLGLIARPGDRVLVIVGSGHKYWIDHFAESTPGFELADPIPYLEAAAETIEAQRAN